MVSALASSWPPAPAAPEQPAVSSGASGRRPTGIRIGRPRRRCSATTSSPLTACTSVRFRRVAAVARDPVVRAGRRRRVAGGAVERGTTAIAVDGEGRGREDQVRTRARVDTRRSARRPVQLERDRATRVRAVRLLGRPGQGRLVADRRPESLCRPTRRVRRTGCDGRRDWRDEALLAGVATRPAGRTVARIGRIRGDPLVPSRGRGCEAVGAACRNGRRIAPAPFGPVSAMAGLEICMEVRVRPGVIARVRRDVRRRIEWPVRLGTRRRWSATARSTASRCR